MKRRSRYNSSPASPAAAWASVALLVVLAGPGGLRLGADSLWGTEPRLTQFADRRALAVGDIVTVLVRENNSTSKDARNKTSKQSAIDANINSFLFSPASSGLMTKGGKLPSLDLGAKSTADNGGEMSSNDSITTRFAVRVVDVLPNENLVVEGIRQTSFGGESQKVILRGTLRRNDVTPANTVFSYNLADLSLSYSGTGVLSDARRKGWFQRAWDKVSPF